MYYILYFILYIILYIYNPKNRLKFKLLAFWKKQTPSLTKNAPLENVTKNLGRALPPPSQPINDPKLSWVAQKISTKHCGWLLRGMKQR